MHLGLLRVLELFELKNSSSFIFELELLEIKKKHFYANFTHIYQHVTHS